MEFKVKLLSRTTEAQNTITYRFERPSNFSYIAGQYVYLTIPLEGLDPRGDTRQFTLSSSPSEKDLAITMRVRSESIFKETLGEMELGSTVSVRGPNGFFFLEENVASPQIMIAGGIGVTPFRSMVKFVADKGLSTPIHLVYSNSIPEEIAFREEFDQLASAHSNIKVTFTVTKPEESKKSWNGLTGRIDEDFLTKNVFNAEFDPRKSTFWLCGPPGMVSAMEETFEKMRISSEKLKTEKFTGY